MQKQINIQTTEGIERLNYNLKNVIEAIKNNDRESFTFSTYNNEQYLAIEASEAPYFFAVVPDLKITIPREASPSTLLYIPYPELERIFKFLERIRVSLSIYHRELNEISKKQESLIKEINNLNQLAKPSEIKLMTTLNQLGTLCTKSQS